jgi:hypothetical protein
VTRLFSTHCGDYDVAHERHEYFRGVTRFDCPGTVANRCEECGGVPGPCAECGRLRDALQRYHELVPALADCANEYGAALLYSELKQANDIAAAALGVEAS